MFKLFTIIILGLSSSTYKTAQTPDTIIFDGKKYNLHTTPLSEYFDLYPKKHPENFIKNSGSIIISSANWRGYTAKFNFVNNFLYVNDIVIEINNDSLKEYESIDDYTKSISVIKKLFPVKKDRKLSWYSGILVLPHGKIVNYIHMGFASTYEKYILLEVENGMLKKTKKLNSNSYNLFREKQFLAFKKTEEFKRLMKLNREKEDASSDEDYEHFLKIYVINYTSKFLVD